MLILTVEFTVPAAERERFLVLAGDLTGPTLAEEGCHQFEFWADPEDRGRFLLFERWESEGHLASHRSAPHVAAFKESVAGLGATLTPQVFPVAGE